MFTKATSGRDAFTFSLMGMTAKAPIGPMPVVPDQRINTVLDEKLSRGHEDQPDTARLIEDVLARYFAPGCDRAA